MSRKVKKLMTHSLAGGLMLSAIESLGHAIEMLESVDPVMAEEAEMVMTAVCSLSSKNCDKIATLRDKVGQ